MDCPYIVKLPVHQKVMYQLVHQFGSSSSVLADNEAKSSGEIVCLQKLMQNKELWWVLFVKFCGFGSLYKTQTHHKFARLLWFVITKQLTIQRLILCHETTKHVEMGCNFVRERVNSGDVVPCPIPTEFQYADIKVGCP